MKMIKMTTAVCGAAMLMQAGVASAQPITAEGADPANAFVGSDTYDGVMRELFETHGLVVAGDTNFPGNGGTDATLAGILSDAAHYFGYGSSTGERVMEGDTTGSDRAQCVNTTGCQEIAPMSRQFDGSNCDDQSAAGGEGLEVCDDGLSVFTDNSSMKGDNAGACTDWVDGGAYTQSINDTGNDFVGTVGQLGVAGPVPGTSYTVGANGMAAWKDVLRVVYTGCQNDQGDCVGAIDRLTRCDDAGGVRRAIIMNWDVIQGGVDCGAGDTCPGGLRRAYRRDDNSGTTGVFLKFLGVDDNLTGRPKVVSSALDCANADDNRCCDLPGDVIRIWGIPGDHSFCDGGQNENYLPDCQNGNFIQNGGDPVKKPCLPEDDLCGPDGTGGVVQAIGSTPSETDAFATHQCTGNGYGNVDFLGGAKGSAGTVNQTMCPDATKPTGSLCNLPKQNVVATTSNCMAASRSHSPAALATTDGRSYNAVRRRAAGAVVYDAANNPQVPTWRMNSFLAETSSLGGGRFNNGFEINDGSVDGHSEEVCLEDSATRQIGCIVASTTCTIGFAGREATYAPGEPTESAGNEPFKIQNLADGNNSFPPRDMNIGPVAADQRYELQRALYVNSLGGFDQMTAECTARGGKTQWCADQKAVANAFYNICDPAVDAGCAGTTGEDAFQSCTAAGFIPRNEATVRCVGSMAAAGCGSSSVTQGKANNASCLPN